jgi:2,4-dienoyl-CoA reductase-like NADH-dependent reductase (Old Yellow Enzyme family)
VEIMPISSSPIPVHLARPLALPGGGALPNRIVKAAMSEVLAQRDTGAPTEALVQLYSRWASSGAGLLLTGNVMVSRDSRGEPGNVVIEDERDLALLKRWAAAAQEHGAQLWMQINHAGRQVPRSVTAHTVAPSAVAMKGVGGLFSRPRALEEGEIEAIVDRFAETARIAKLAGFAGVQIHAAHGYLISQFLSPLANLREDAWGGDAERRMRFLLEIVRATRAAVGPSFPIAVKLNSADFQRGGFGEDESMAVVEALAKEGIDLLEISGGNYESPAMMGSPKLAPRKSTVAREAYFLEYARKARGLVAVPLLLTGGLRTARAMESVVADGEVDAVGLARPLAFEPDLPARLLAGTAAGARGDVEARVGIRLFDDLLQSLFSQAQMARLAAGLAPDANLSRWWVLLAGIVHGYLWSPFRSDPRPAMPRPPARPRAVAESTA